MIQLALSDLEGTYTDSAGKNRKNDMRCKNPVREEFISNNLSYMR